MKNKIFKKNFLKGTCIEERIADLYIFMMLTIYPLYIGNYFIGGQEIKYMIFILITFLCSSVIVYRNVRGKTKKERKPCRLDIFMLILFTVTALTRVVGGLDSFAKTTELAAICAYGLGYFAVVEYGKARLEHVKLFLNSSVMVFVLLLPGIIRDMLQIEIFQNAENLLSYYWLVLAAAATMYLQEKKQWKKFYFFIIFTAFQTLLLLSNEISALLIFPIVFSVSLIVLRPALTVLKGLLELIFSTLIIFKIFTLIVQYGQFKRFLEGASYRITSNLFFDIALVTVGILYCLFLDNTLHYNAMEMKKQYPKVKQAAANIFEFALFLGVIGVILAEPFGRINPLFGTKWYIQIVSYISGCIQESSTAYGQLLEKGGIIALIIVVFMLFAAVGTLTNSNRMNKCKRIGLILLAILFFQSFFYPFEAASAPVYMIVAALSLGTEGETENERDGAVCEE